MKINERKRLIRSIREEARLLHKHQDGLLSEDPRRQDVIDNDLQVLHNLLREIMIHTGVDAAALNAL